MFRVLGFRDWGLLFQDVRFKAWGLVFGVRV